MTSRSAYTPPIIGHVVGNDLCIGCGACAGTCPASCLSISFGSTGEYRPSESDVCNGCGVCMNVCPFGPGNKNEDDLGRALYGEDPSVAHRAECGYYRSSYVGYSPEHRNKSASGGLATWTLEALLKSGYVDRVISVAPNPCPEKLFKFAVIDSVPGLRQCAGSVYYPIELSEVLHTVLSEDAKYAAIGLPCFIKALRLSALVNRKISERIVFHAGLVCGFLMNRFFAEYVALLAGGNPSRLQGISFRAKAADCPATNPLLRLHYAQEGDNPELDIHHFDGPVRAWAYWFFKHNACNFCDDTFAELADVTFMDAWLPDYSSDPRGTSLAITRTESAQAILENGRAAGLIKLEDIPIEPVIASQAAVSKAKREDLAVRLAVLRDENKYVPQKRVDPSDKPNKQELKHQKSLMETQNLSKRNWGLLKSAGLHQFHNSIPALRSEIRRAWVRSVKRRLKSTVGKLFI